MRKARDIIVYEYLQKMYGEGVPIFIERVEIAGYTNNAIRKQFYDLVKKGLLI